MIFSIIPITLYFSRTHPIQGFVAFASNVIKLQIESQSNLLYSTSESNTYCGPTTILKFRLEHLTIKKGKLN
jgi:hypothetical protein